MKLILHHLGRLRGAVALALLIKLIGTAGELLLPTILEHIIDEVVPSRDLTMVLLWGGAMFATAFAVRTLNVIANHRAVDNAHRISFALRQSLFEKTVNLSGASFDGIGLPSLISRMTSDSYNVQSAVQQLQTLSVRAPIMLVGGIIVSALMDFQLSLILIVMLPILIAVVLTVSARGIPLYTKVQKRLDAVVRIMREAITGIRVVKALRKEDYESKRFREANAALTDQDVTAATVMAIPGPFMQLCLNSGLALVVIIGAGRVNSGEIKPGVILAFLTYFNMVAMGIFGLTRIFMTISRASASADRISAVLALPDGDPVLPEAGGLTPSGPGFIRFEHVSFSYNGVVIDNPEGGNEPRVPDRAAFAGEEREKALSDISFSLARGESLGIIGPTGCGKTTVISLLMRFYDADEGGIFVDGRDVRTYEKEALRRKFGTVFQNDIIFRDTIRGNISFGRDLDEEAVREAAASAQASEFISELPKGLDHEMDIRGANVSGGQKQRILVARALAASPEILVLDDSSSALDYRTDAAMRSAISRDYPEATVIMIAQRVSSIMGMTKILVMDNGRCIGYGSHKDLMQTCPFYRETCEIQMGDME